MWCVGVGVRVRVGVRVCVGVCVGDVFMLGLECVAGLFVAKQLVVSTRTCMTRSPSLHSQTSFT